MKLREAEGSSRRGEISSRDWLAFLVSEMIGGVNGRPENGSAFDCATGAMKTTIQMCNNGR